MNVYELVRDRAKRNDVAVTTGDIERIVGTLRTAGIQRQVVGSSIPIAQSIVDDALRREANKTIRIASTQGVLKSADNGMCPKCKTAMGTVKLSGYENALYCESCRATLWT